jgi:hypothetical protein
VTAVSGRVGFRSGQAGHLFRPLINQSYLSHDHFVCFFSARTQLSVRTRAEKILRARWAPHCEQKHQVLMKVFVCGLYYCQKTLRGMDLIFSTKARYTPSRLLHEFGGHGVAKICKLFQMRISYRLGALMRRERFPGHVKTERGLLCVMPSRNQTALDVPFSGRRFQRHPTGVAIRTVDPDDGQTPRMHSGYIRDYDITLSWR